MKSSLLGFVGLLACLTLWAHEPRTLQEDKIKSYIKQLGAPYHEERKTASLELERIGAAAEPHLITGLSEEDYRIKVGCIRLLSKLDSQKAVPAVGKLFEADPDDVVRIEAFKFLKAIGQAAEGYMIKALDLEDSDVRLDAVQYLKQHRVAKGLEKLLALYRSKDIPAEIKNECFEYFLNLGKPAGPVLLDELKTQDEQKKRSIIEALGNCRYDKGEAVEIVAGLISKNSAQPIQEAAVDYLAKIGAPAESHLIKLLKHDSMEFKVKAIVGLGTVKSDVAIESLIGLVNSPQEEIKNAAVDSVLSVGARVFEVLDKAVEEKRLDADDVKKMRQWYDEKEIVSLIEKLIVASETSNFYGFYEGQFNDLKSLDLKKTRIILLQIVEADLVGAADKQILRWIKNRQSDYVVSLCIMALADVGDKAAAKKLKEIMDKAQESLSAGLKEPLRIDFTTTLYKLGDHSAFDAMVAALEKDEKDKSSDQHYTAMFRKAMIHYRVGVTDKAEQIYKDLIRLVEKEDGDRKGEIDHYRTAWYNLACLYSKAGKKKEAMESLRQAVRNKFDERRHLLWIERDGDLDNIRKEEGYRELIDDLKSRLGGR